jgi:hypothetical protein
MTSFIEIKETTTDEQIVRIKLPDLSILHIDWDKVHSGINIRFRGKFFWLYTPDVVTVHGEVVPNITLCNIIKLLGYENNSITINVDCNYSVWNELVYLLPLCEIVIHPICQKFQLYSHFESGFTPLLQSVM